MTTKKIFWIIAIVFAITIGLYPITYLLFDMSKGLLSSKPSSVLTKVYSCIFYVHIASGGLALLIGWVQFSKTVRARYIKFHRTLGKIYLTAILLGGTAGLYISFYASGGLPTSVGFASLALCWLGSTIIAYNQIRSKEIERHREWMVRSYALTFAAVTLRLWIPTFQFALSMEFITAYRIIAWLCWVPNLFFAEWLIRTKSAKA